MKTLIVLLILLFSCSLVFADFATLAGVSWTPVTKTYSTSGSVSGATVWTPATGKRIVLLGACISSENQLAKIGLETNYTSGPGGTDIIPDFTSTGPVVISSSIPIWEGGVNESIYLTRSKACVPSIVLWGYEH